MELTSFGLMQERELQLVGKKSTEHQKDYNGSKLKNYLPVVLLKVKEFYS
jgi:hypothetical protein